MKKVWLAEIENKILLNIWMAWCKRDVLNKVTLLGRFFFLQKCLNFFNSVVNHSPVFFWLVCTLFLRKTKTKYRSVHNERNKAKLKHFSQKKIEENIVLLNWKAHAKIQALSKKSLASLLHQAIHFSLYAGVKETLCKNSCYCSQGYGQTLFCFKRHANGAKGQYNAQLTISPCLFVKPLITAITATLWSPDKFSVYL